MKAFWLAMCGGVLSMTVGAGVAQSQTVIVTNAAPGSTIELRFNTEAPRTASADADGQATIPIGLPPTVDESDVRFAIDRCGTVTRLHLFNPGVQPPAAAAGCDRREIPSLFA